MKNRDHHSEFYSEFESYLKDRQLDKYLNFYVTVTILEQGNLEESKVKKLYTTIMNQYLGLGENSDPELLLTVEPMYLNEIRSRKNNPTPQLFKPIKEEVLGQLESQYLGFLNENSRKN